MQVITNMLTYFFLILSGASVRVSQAVLFHGQ